jgi:pseudomonalisin
LTAYLSRSTEREVAFQRLLLAQQTPDDPSFHSWYSASQLGRQFGATDRQIQAVTAWLNENGLQVLNVSNSKTFIEFSGTIAAISSAFAVNFHWFQGNGRNRWSIISDPKIPSSLASTIRSISGLSMVLDNSPLRRGPSGTAYSMCTGDICRNYITPNDFATIYNLVPVSASGINGAGRVIDVIAEALIDPADVPAFNTVTQSAAPLPSVIVPPANATPPPAPLTAPPNPSCTSSNSTTPVCVQLQLQQEATLDVERAGSVASGASLQLIVSTGDSMGDRGTLVDTQYAVESASTPDIITISFYYCESASVAPLAGDWNGLFEQAAAEGISVFVSSGDSDATCYEEKFAAPTESDQFLSVNYLCSSSSVTCVGGTEFVEGNNQSRYWGSNGNGYGSALEYIPEGAWNDPMQTDSQGNTAYEVEGSGGGISQLLPAPPWQLSIAPFLGRALPDVAFSSSCHDAYLVCMESNGSGDNCVQNSSGGFRFASFCGTSAATPSMAGIMALVDQANSGRQGNPNPALYALAANPANEVFHDTTVASSGVVNCNLYTASMCNNTSPSATGVTGGALGYVLQTGFDEVTGWGSINVQNLIANWKPAPSLSANPPLISIGAPGGAGSTNISIVGFPMQNLSLSCSNLPPSSECYFGDITADNTVTLSVLTDTARLGSGEHEAHYLPLSVCVVTVWFFAGYNRIRRTRRKVNLLQLLFLAMLGLSPSMSCGKESTPVGTTAITVKATEGSLSASTQIQVSIE